MKELVISFEDELKSGFGENSPEFQLYSSVLNVLKEGFGYADLESVFSVIKGLAQNIRISGLGFASAYALRRSGMDVRIGRLARDAAEQTTAAKLLDMFQKHIRKK